MSSEEKDATKTSSEEGLLNESPIPPAPPPDLFVARKEFHLKEYDSLKKELADLVEHSHKLEIYAVVGIAAFYSWLLLQTGLNSTQFKMALTIPVLVAVFGGFRSWSVLTRIIEIAKYLRDVEKVFALHDLGLVGWETHRKKKNSSPFLTSAAVFWTVLTLVAASLFLGNVIATWKTPPEQKSLQGTSHLKL